MMKRLGILMAATLLVSACGGAADELADDTSDAAASDNAASEPLSVEERVFRTAFVSSCVVSAGETGLGDEQTKNICECSADKVLAEMGPVDDISDEDAVRVVGECVAELSAAEG